MAQGVSATATNGSCTAAPGTVVCVIPVLRSGASAAITVNATPKSAGMFTSSGSVSGDQPDPDTTDNATTLAATAAIVTDLSVAASGPATAQVGDAITYTLDVSNIGPNASTAARLRYRLANGLALQSVSSGSASCSETGNNVSCAVGTLAVGASTSVSIVATATTAGAQTATATVSTGDIDPLPSNNTATTSTNVTSSAPATSPTTTPASQGTKGGGGALGLWQLVGLLPLLGYRRRARSQTRCG